MRNKRGEEEVTIVKRRGKKGSHEPHGGAWKVAFADFTMAMMALFMVLWIVQPQGKQDTQQDAVSESAGAPNPLFDGGAGIFDGNNNVLVDLGGGVPLPVPQPYQDLPAEIHDRARDIEMVSVPAGAIELAELAQVMREVADEVGALANLEVEVVPQGLRILVRDDEERYMFQRGSARLDPRFAELLTRLAGVLGRVDNRLIISGHTDATPFRGNGSYNNWNLSGDRALQARNTLVAAGLPARQVLQVTAQADGMPLLPDDPESGINRRIELLLLTERAEQLYQDLFGDRGSHARFGGNGARFVEGG